MGGEFRGGIYAINASAGAVVVCTGELSVGGVCDRPSVNQIMSVYKVFGFLAPFGKVFVRTVGISLPMLHAVPIAPNHPLFLWGCVGEGTDSTQAGVWLGGEVDRGISDRALCVIMCSCDGSEKPIVCVACGHMSDCV